MTKTGGGGGQWVTFDSPKPPPVTDRYAHWTTPPPELSERCRWWLRQIQLGWRPNRAWRAEGYDSAADLYGVWIWEYQRVIFPRLAADVPQQEVTAWGSGVVRRWGTL